MIDLDRLKVGAQVLDRLHAAVVRAERVLGRHWLTFFSTANRGWLAAGGLDDDRIPANTLIAYFLWRQDAEVSGVSEPAGVYRLRLRACAHRLLQEQPGTTPTPVRVLTILDGWWYAASGTVRSVVNLVHHLGDDFDVHIVSRAGPDVPLGGGTDATDVYRKARSVSYLDPATVTWARLRGRVGAVEPDVVLLNSVLSVRFSLKYLVLRRLGALPRVPVVLAVRGELSAAALALKSLRKRLFLAVAPRLGLFRGGRVAGVRRPGSA